MPKKGSEDLFKLIKSLTPSEKGYFKRFSEKHTIGDKNNYLKLFDAIDKQIIYDEKKLLKEEKYLKQLPKLKNYLHELIMKSLSVYHAHNSIESELKTELQYAEILCKKALYPQCTKLLQKIKKTAIQYEQYPLLIDVLDSEYRLNDFLTPNSANRITYLKQRTENVEKIKIESELISIRTQLWLIVNEANAILKGDLLKKFKNTVNNHPLLKKKDKRFSLYNQYLFNFIHYYFYIGTKEYKKAYDLQKENIKLIETNLDFFNTKAPSAYFLDLKNHHLIARQLNKEEGISLCLKKLRLLWESLELGKNIAFESQIFQVLFILEILQYIDTIEIEKAEGLIKEIEDGLERYREQLETTEKMLLNLSISETYFLAGQYSNALKSINRILNESENKKLKNRYRYTQILNLIVHIELKNNNLIPYAFKSSLLYKYPLQMQYKTESLFSDFIKKIIKAKNREEQKQDYKTLLNRLKKIEHHASEKNILDSFPFIYWAESKIENIPLREILERKFKK